MLLVLLRPQRRCTTTAVDVSSRVPCKTPVLSSLSLSDAPSRMELNVNELDDDEVSEEAEDEARPPSPLTSTPHYDKLRELLNNHNAP